MKWIDALPENRRRGSFPRCLCFMTGDRLAVASRLTTLVDLPEVRVEADDFWMPSPLPSADGTWMSNSIDEAVLLDSDGNSKWFLTDQQRIDLAEWWLAARERANSPNWDIASTCKIEGEQGLLLVEAKAHTNELETEGKTLREKPSRNSEANHKQIGKAIAEASIGLGGQHLGWNLSCSSHYQLANRFAWAWKLASINIPVVLVYLGFLGATEMRDHGQSFVDCSDWTRILLNHARNCVPDQAWGRRISVGRCSIKPLIRVWKQNLSIS